MIFVAEMYYTAQHCSESIMMTDEDGMRIRVANDACEVNTAIENEKTPCNYSCFLFPQLWSVTEQKLVNGEEVTKNKQNK